MHTYLDDFPNHRIAVIGDVMLDSYLSGEVKRISPEAPVPVMRVTFPDTHCPFSHTLEEFCLPNADRIETALQRLAAY